MTTNEKFTGKRRPHRFISKATQDFLKEARGVKKFSMFDFIHGYTYSRWSHFYVSLAISAKKYHLKFAFDILVSIYSIFLKLLPKNRGIKGISFEDSYHGKAIPIDSAKKLVSIKESIHIGDLEKVIPYKSARDIILKNPDHILALQCPCRSAREHPCLPMDVCLIIGEPFASFIMEHKPDRARWITSIEAVDILEAEEERGHVHHAFFKDAMLGRFYAICNCCECCCGAIQAHKRGTPMLASSGYIAVVDDEACVACGQCLSYCQFNALSMTNDGLQIDTEKCMGCGVCVSHCPQGALSLKLSPQKGLPLDITKLIKDKTFPE